MTQPTGPEIAERTGAGFTPGPWSLVENRYGEFVFVRPETDETVALFDDNEFLGSYEESCANARLIAAAPDLYEALAGFAAARDAYLESDGESKAERIAAGRLDAAHEIAERALAKARGEA